MMEDNDLETNISRKNQKFSDRKQLKDQCMTFLDSTLVTAFMTLITIYALFSDDVRVLCFQKGSDTAFVVVSSIAFFLFIIEIGVQCWCRDKYLMLPNAETIKDLRRASSWSKRLEVLRSVFKIGSFYFWLDLLATLSMIFELPWIFPYSSDGVDGSLENARAGKASRAGAKAARILKVVRMIRLVRLVKLYKYFSESKNKKEGSVVPDDEALDNMPPESHVGAEMSDRTTKKVIVGILIMLMVLPLLQVDDFEYHNEFGMQMVLNSRMSISEANGFDVTYDSWEFAETLFLNTTDCVELVYTGFNNSGSYDEVLIPEGRSDPEKLRTIEKRVITISNEGSQHALTAAFDISKRVDEEALLGILLTTFVIILLAAGTMTFSRDVNSLVIIPIEQMVQLVREISANPLGKNFSLSPDELRGTDDGMETTLLLRTISKIAGLMRVGFGEAGAEIIGKNLNMSNDEHGGKSMNLLGKGTKILSIFGFCDVRNFTDTTECLQEEVMLFVNRIAHILHSIVVHYDGAANKNIGDAFLLTWKLNPKKIGNCIDNGYSADKALYSFLKTMVEMIRHEDFICNFSPAALGALYERMPGYKCRIGCGLHFGWAVEGAIGSDKKIDASYISPHVNWAEFLESSTKSYGVSILMSEPFFNLLSPQVSRHCRQVDRIKKSENDDVTSLYTYDTNLKLDFDKDRRNSERMDQRTTIFGKKAKIGTRQLRRKESTQKIVSMRARLRNQSMIGDAPEIELKHFTTDLWSQDSDIVNLRIHLEDDMRKEWDKGMIAYIKGDWKTASKHFELVYDLSDKTDGPAHQLLQWMRSQKLKAPEDWQGFRNLDKG